MVRRFGAPSIETIEDVVQEAMEKALATWATKEIPPDPSAWIRRVARNGFIDRIRRSNKLQSIVEQELSPPWVDADPQTLPQEVNDDMLRMLFICCDPALPEKTQLVLALKILCGFSPAEIAARLFQTEDAVRKRITRGRKQFHDLSPEFDSPDSAGFQARLGEVCRVIYLMFNEGYYSLRQDKPIRRELCAESVRLGEILLNHPYGAVPSVKALLALMYLHTARLTSRLDQQGELLLLDEQDRSQWDRAMIAKGAKLLSQASFDQGISRYHFEAAIVAEHCLAESRDDTDWAAIVRYYEAYERFAPSPLLSLNRAIALSEWKGAAEGIALLESLTPPNWVSRYFLWDATLGELYRRDNQPERAVYHLELAIQAAPTEADKNKLTIRRDAVLTAV